EADFRVTEQAGRAEETSGSELPGGELRGGNQENRGKAGGNAQADLLEPDGVAAGAIGAASEAAIHAGLPAESVHGFHGVARGPVVRRGPGDGGRVCEIG